MSHNYRCTSSGCRLRVSLAKPIEQYAREKACPSCGGRLSHDPAVARQRKKNLCRCDGAWFPHRKGSVPLCVHHQGPVDEEEAREWIEKTASKMK